MKSAGGSMGGLALHVGADWWTFLCTYEDHTPILDVHAGSSTVTICISGTKADQAAVEFAQELASQAALFAAEVERLHARHLAASGGEEGSPSGNGEAA